MSFFRKFVPELWPFIYAKIVFPLNLVEFHQILYMHSSWQDLVFFPLFQGLLYAQDGVAKQEVRSSEGEPPDDNNFYIPSLPAGDSIKIVHLEKTTEPLVSLWVLATLTLKAPPIICSRRQFQILPLFQK